MKKEEKEAPAELGSVAKTEKTIQLTLTDLKTLKEKGEQLDNLIKVLETVDEKITGKTAMLLARQLKF